jgi:pimeloyl-ACP methyl ester carboxylesterase
MPTVRRPDADLYYETAGDGPPLVFVHGAGGNTLVWWQQVPYFAPRHRVLTFDHRGFGRSRCTEGEEQARHFAADLTAILDAAGVARAALVCQSMGGWTGLQLALTAPERVGALVLSGTPAGVLTPRVLDALRAIAAGAAAWETRTPAWDNPHPALAPDIFVRDPARGFLYSQLAGLNPPGRLDRLALHELMVEPARLSQWSIPTLVIAGTHDRLFPVEVLREVAGTIPGAAFREIASAGHSPYFEAPAEFNRVVEAFLIR